MPVDQHACTENIYIGTSGFSCKHWKGIYYPDGLKSTEWLTFFAKDFNITEINSSFYNLPKEETVLSWVEKVPKGFIFCPKMSRYVTHMKKLLDPEEPVHRFMEVFHGIKSSLGPILVQLPPFLKFNYDRAEHFYQLLKTEYRDFHFAMEVRHETWLTNDSLDLMAKYDIAFVISQSGDKFPYAEMVTAKNIYMRFHGPSDLYASSYTDEMLQGFADKFKIWVEEGHNIWAFFNNDIHGYAIQNAKRLKEILGV